MRLKEDVESIFNRQKPDLTDEVTEKGHGRIETRQCEVISQLDFLKTRINGKSAENFALIQKIALNLLKSEDSKKISIMNKRLIVAWDKNFLLKILRI